jgi:pilus assembly protein Flp/PilA
VKIPFGLGLQDKERFFDLPLQICKFRPCQSCYNKETKIYKEVEMFVRKGQGLVEYALILVLVAVVVIVVLATLGPTIGAVFSNIISSI